MKRLLAANRGEIALRVMMTARKMGITTIAIYSDIDRDAPFVNFADEAYPLSGTSPTDTYLNQDKIFDLCRLHMIDAVHPGYGFLSENAVFAQRCEDHGISFIGPLASSISAMGDKAAAKRLMEEAGVPLVPGYHGDNQDIAALRQEAAKIGFPVLIKASAGGGGKGMRAVETSAEFEDSLQAAKREAQNAFGDDKVLLEKLILQPRHVEVQVFFDQKGNGVYLFDRDCSIQRRHQKVIEEAPAPNLSTETRKSMGEAALDCGRKIRYRGAGTVEFLLDEQENFYFMEMNTRLQVEHPVTELVTGQDLVEWQIRVARGEDLPLTQDQLKLSGHAVEVRLYAESPTNNFLPSIGRLTKVTFPEPHLRFNQPDHAADKFLRIDSGIATGCEISQHYDPMIAKVITWATDRRQAILHLAEQLKHTLITGVESNNGFLVKALEHSDFLDGKLSTKFITENEQDLLPDESVSLPLISTATALYWNRVASRLSSSRYEDHESSPWNSAELWSLYGTRSNAFEFWLNGKEINVRLTSPRTYSDSSGAFELSFEGHKCEIDYHILDDDTLATRVDGKLREYHYFIDNNQIVVFIDGHGVTIELPNDSSLVQHHGDHAEGTLTAPMGGTIIKVLCEEGQQVEKDQPLLVMEAMKMEHTIKAPDQGRVHKLLCKEKDTVSSQQLLIELQTLDEQEPSNNKQFGTTG
ncbi:acetyl/propionyl/methylcrotonyl-CoA carboxylase subunit alpha [Hahella ganghwensis]|uniref:acetyl/propionyl/methylcrotonyl-CoA carboxylase subunit alpha n=1 Tax=Hahella ganghwensis TaxID=286420 RepID=UPI000381A4A2|nr:biotin carboxylase N-terminal domain-containing protein [Hahella ganghwensis]